MKIVHKLILSSILAILLTIIALGVFFFVDGRMISVHEGQRLAYKIHKSVSELDILTYEYLLYREKRMESQWYLKHEMIEDLLKEGLEFKNSSADMKTFEENILSAHEDLGNLFSKIIELHSKHEAGHILSHGEVEANPSQDLLEEKLIGRMLITSQEMISNASRLNSQAIETMDKVEKQQGRVITIVMVLLALLITLILFLLGKSIIKPLHRLVEGTNVIGRGNLDYRVAVDTKDEIGSLADSFNAMTENLRQTTASRDELNLEIQERIKAERKAQERKEEWEKTFNAMGDIITIQDKDMRILRANKAAYDVFKMEPGALNGRFCYQVFRDASTPCSNCPGFPAIEGKELQNATISHKSLGKVFQVSMSPVLDEDNEIIHIVHIAKDITEQKQLEDELFQAHKMEAIGTLAGGIAHDFNNILAAILGYTDMAMDDIPENSLSHEFLEEVLLAGNRAKELVKQILTFSRKDPGTQHPLLPVPIIKEGLKLMRASLPTTLEIHETIDPNCSSIFGNPTNLHQILVNLCTNALHAMENQKGVLSVSLSQVVFTDDVLGDANAEPGKYVELKVSDTGRGMDEATIERIFEPYFTTKEVGKGSGMGLALVHGIIQGCGGFVNVESQQGKGSTFFVYFPAVEEKAIEEKELKESTLPTGNERILVVDDEKAIAGVYQAILRNLGYQVVAFNNSRQALEVFLSSPDNFDLVITDQTMPDLDGAELTMHILQAQPNMPVVMCTGYSSVMSEENAKELGIKRFLLKPLNRKDLATTVRQVLDEKIGSGVT